MTKTEARAKLVEFAKRINNGYVLTDSEVKAANDLTEAFHFTPDELKFIFIEAR